MELRREDLASFANRFLIFSFSLILEVTLRVFAINTFYDAVYIASIGAPFGTQLTFPPTHYPLLTPHCKLYTSSATRFLGPLRS